MKVKVWGGLVMGPHSLGLSGTQVRVIVRAKSQRAACDAVSSTAFGTLTIGCLRDYWSETGNARELEVATEDGVWYSPERNSGCGEFKRAPTVRP